jgi:D-alanyl-D-alanine carboxypeptidase
VTDEARRDRKDLRRPSPRIRRNRVIAALIAGVVFVALLVAAIFVFAPHPEGAPVAESPSPSASPTPSSSPTPRPDAPLKLTFDRRTYSIDDPASLWVVVNKLRPLNPLDYAAPDLVSVPVPYVNAPTLRQEASGQIVAMFAQYTAETGNQMQSQSAYRSFGVQQNVYQGWVNQLGQAGADLTSARPGHSEHQTGLAMDISGVPAVCALDQCFADTDQGQWLAANAYKWGFILRYPNGLTNITGYEFEPWHYRYVGVALATEMHNTGIQTLEEFFGLPAAPDYAG